MPKKRMDEALGGVVEDCIDAVGVDLNTASPSLFEQVAGISGTVSKNIVAYGEKNGAFQSRKELKKVLSWDQKPLNNVPVSCGSAKARIFWTIPPYIRNLLKQQKLCAISLWISAQGFGQQTGEFEGKTGRFESFVRFRATWRWCANSGGYSKGTAAARARSSRGVASPTAAYGCTWK